MYMYQAGKENGELETNTGIQSFQVKHRLDKRGLEGVRGRRRVNGDPIVGSELK